MINRTRALMIAAAIASVAGVPAPTSAQQVNGPYVMGGAGLNWTRDADISGARTGTLEFKTGGIGAAALGYGFGNGLRGEAELGYRRNGVDKANTGAADGHASSWALMGNLLYD